MNRDSKSFHHPIRPTFNPQLNIYIYIYSIYIYKFIILMWPVFVFLKEIIPLWCQLHWALNQENLNVHKCSFFVLTELFATPVLTGPNNTHTYIYIYQIKDRRCDVIPESYFVISHLSPISLCFHFFNKPCDKIWIHLVHIWSSCVEMTGVPILVVVHSLEFFNLTYLSAQRSWQA